MKKLRKRRHYTIAELADLSRFSGALISKLERGHTLPELRRWLRLAQILCRNQSEYDELRALLLSTLGAEDADHEFLPKKFDDLKVIDPDSSEIPRGVLRTIKTDQEHSQVEELLKQAKLDLSEHGQALKNYPDTDEPHDGGERSFMIVHGDTGDIHELIYVEQYPLLQEPRLAWLRQTVGRITLDEFYQKQRKARKGCVAIILVRHPIPEILIENEKALNGQGISFGSTIAEARARFVGNQM